MGIVNVTPDSFSDGGAHASTAAALRHCEQLLEEGADILDIGGESTRPGSPAVPLEAELARVLPVVREAVKLDVPISIDTYKPRGHARGARPWRGHRQRHLGAAPAWRGARRSPRIRRAASA